jgi:putative protease
MNQQTPELLLPVGTFAMAQAAFTNGASAIYVGVPQFNARGRSKDFSFSELQLLITQAKAHNVRVFLAFNVVIFESEWPKVEKLIDQLIPLGPDALIIQDIGLVNFLHSQYPNFPIAIHASTQMTVTNHLAIELLSDLPIQRFVLGREVSLKELQIIRGNTTKELEVFVHGALCVAYSGQCFTSESLGGRSANRGQCAQSCRLPYTLLVDGQIKTMLDQQYLFSPQDLLALDLIPKLMEMGINSFKVEGRLKTPQYVAQAAQSYGAIIEGESEGKGKSKKINFEVEKTKLSLTYSRGFHSGWLEGVDHQKLVRPQFQSAMGVKIGHLIKFSASPPTPPNVRRLMVAWAPEGDEKLVQLTLGQGLMLHYFDSKSATHIKWGGEIVDLKINKTFHWVTLKNRSGENCPIPMTLMSPTALVNIYLTHEPKLMQELLKPKRPVAKIAKSKISLELKFEGHLGSPLTITFSFNEFKFQVSSDEKLLVPQKQFCSSNDYANYFKENLKGSPYEIKSWTTQSDFPQESFLPLSQLKKLKKAALIQLQNNIIQLKTPSCSEEKRQNSYSYPLRPLELPSHPAWHLLLREPNQVVELIKFHQKFPHLKQDVALVTLDFEFGKEYAPSINELKAHHYLTGVATTRILKAGENQNLRFIERASPDVVLIRNLGALFYFQQKSTNQQFSLMGDYSLNVTNHQTANYLQTKGLNSLCPSLDLNLEQLLHLLDSKELSSLANFEIPLHFPMPLFHMEHCVFAATLSKGKSYVDCGRPCEKHHVQVEDPYGKIHTLTADMECRNTLFKGEWQNGIHFLPKFLERKVKLYRLEFLKSDQKLTELMLSLAGIFKAPQSWQPPKNLPYEFDEGNLQWSQSYRDKKKYS